MMDMDMDVREVLQHEIQQLMLPLDKTSKQYLSYEQLLTALSLNPLPEEQMGVLEHVLEIVIGTGRIRHVYSAFQEQKLLHFYRQTPTGIRLHTQLKEVNASLQAITGHKIENISFSLKKPGEFGLTIDTDQCQIVMHMNRRGVFLDQIALEL